MLSDKLKPVCSKQELADQRFLIKPICYKKQPTTAVVFAVGDKYFAYINHCMHMQRPLNCQEDNVFDETGKYLRCSMHGFIFEPSTGECLSPVCLGQKLHALKLQEIGETLYFAEKHLTLNAEEAST